MHFLRTVIFAGALRSVERNPGSDTMARKTIRLSNTPFFVPPHTRGDREYNGHGPQIWITTRLYVSELRKIKASIWAKFREDRHDWTTAEGSINLHVFDATYDPDIERINYIVSPGSLSNMYFKQESGHDEFTVPENAGPVREYRLVGDTRGKEAGNRTGVEVRFRDVEIDYVPAGVAPPQVVTVDGIAPITYVPPHVRGDRDFDGNGPRIFCSVTLQIRNGNELWVRIYMYAGETKSDWTTAAGFNDFHIYTHSRLITEIVSDTASAYSYTDYDHEDDIFPNSAGELVSKFNFIGDTRGDEAGTKTRVQVHFNPIFIREET